MSFIFLAASFYKYRMSFEVDFMTDSKTIPVNRNGIDTTKLFGPTRSRSSIFSYSYPYKQATERNNFIKNVHNCISDPLYGSGSALSRGSI